MLKFKQCVGFKDNYIARNGKYTFYIDENFVVNIDETKINSIVDNKFNSLNEAIQFCNNFIKEII